MSPLNSFPKGDRMLVLIALLALALATPPSDTDWSRFRRPNSSGISATKGLPAEFSPDKNVVWKVELPQGYSSPIIHGNRIFLTALREASLVTIAVDRDNGKVLWEKQAPRVRTEKLDKRNRPAAASAATDGEHVSVFFGDYGLHHLRRERQGALEAAARPVQQRLRHGRVTRHRRRQGHPGLRPANQLLHRGVGQEDRQEALADARASRPRADTRRPSCGRRAAAGSR